MTTLLSPFLRSLQLDESKIVAIETFITENLRISRLPNRRDPERTASLRANDALIRDLAQKNLRIDAIAAQLGVTTDVLGRYVHSHGIKVKRGRVVLRGEMKQRLIETLEEAFLKGDIEYPLRLDEKATCIASRFGISAQTVLRMWKEHMRKEAIRTARAQAS